MSDISNSKTWLILLGNLPAKEHLIKMKSVMEHELIKVYSYIQITREGSITQLTFNASVQQNLIQEIIFIFKVFKLIIHMNTPT